MKITSRRPARARTGFTLLESIVSLAIFSMVGYTLSMAFGAGTRTEHTVMDTTEQERSMRSTVDGMLDELRTSNDARIIVATLADGNHSVTFMTPITVGTAIAWGVHDRLLGNDDTTQNRANWSIRYTVTSTVAPDGAVTRRLVRQVLDAGLAVQRQEVVLERLRNGTANPAGFRVVKQGSMWVVTLSTDGESANDKGIRVVFHVQARNK